MPVRASLLLTSDQVGIPAELKHINKRRKRNQQGLPQAKPEETLVEARSGSDVQIDRRIWV
ncbi:hypothetical protein P174DRAFT_235729 [Aspergillus novofumigatus IBT 16806]|uniref:Uncharacterized protein n=1 Tax=Aspergillus novofumigatus (strain IBT 16806) TaxID=1392255 RepID=A0A2I1C790_ASPN1|nr:hypothetical protein P174DRAFT_235729 [Aspergillus novofumigatus IBT 16806]